MLNLKLNDTPQHDLALLNTEQLTAYESLLNWLYNSTNNVAMLEGKPGVGKTFLLKYVIATYKKRAIFTAPTNKATKVLKEVLTSENYLPDTCTIYSLLGLSMTTNGEVKEIKADKEDINIKRYSLVVVDEYSMINSSLKKYIDKAMLNNSNVKWLFLGDSYQLPPVNESKSPIEEYFREDYGNLRIKLSQVMRHSGNILKVVDEVREAIDKPLKFSLPFLDNYYAEEIPNNLDELDVCVVSQEKMLELILDEVKQSKTFSNSKIIAWQNKTVDFFNSKVRKSIYPNSHKDNFFELGDIVTITAPARDFVEDKTIATTDDMGRIEAIDYVSHPSLSGFDAARLRVILTDNTPVILYAIAPYDKAKWTQLLTKAFNEAKVRVRTWKDYWELHDQIHYVRHAYAITAHRSQGSTYNKVYVNLADILRNQNRVESLKCLFVAMSRAKSKLIIGR